LLSPSISLWRGAASARVNPWQTTAAQGVVSSIDPESGGGSLGVASNAALHWLIAVRLSPLM